MQLSQPFAMLLDPDTGGQSFGGEVVFAGCGFDENAGDDHS